MRELRIEQLLQPIDGQAGEYLKAALSSLSGPRSRLVMVSAWVKLSGLSRVWNEIISFREAGGHVLAITGIDLQGTSREALEHLIEATDDAYVIYDENPQRSFHPKFYLVTGNEQAILLTGSGNLTQGGLFTNYELFDLFDLDLNEEPDQNLLNLVENQVSKLLSDKETARLLNQELVTQLTEASLVVSEATAPRTETGRRQHAGKTSPFGVRKGLPNAPPPQIPLPPKTSVKVDEDIKAGLLPEVPEEEMLEVEVSEESGEAEVRVLVQLAPVSRGRQSQLGIAANVMEDFFGLTPQSGATIELQQVQPGQSPGEWEERRLVFPEGSNRNRRIEVSGLRDIRARPDRRPILVFEELTLGRYKYLILMPGDGGYPELLGHLQSLPPTRSMAHDTTTRQKLLAIWSSYPV